jgi:hypothetical protein
MKPTASAHTLPAALMAAFLLTGCLGTGGTKTESTAAAPAPAPAPAAAPAAAATPSGVKPGMNARGDVIDSKKVEAGSGTKVKGIGDWEGEITGRPVPGSKFSELKIGMSSQQVLNLLGQPNDAGSHVTGKAFIPFYFGSDRARYETVYKGQGRLIFAMGGGMFGSGSMNLIWIIHNANETDTR